jgi:PAS domain S-box-containing protein
MLGSLQKVVARAPEMDIRISDTDAPSKVSILLVDDEPANLLALETILSDLGQTLIQAHSGEDALKNILDEDFAVVLLDVQMKDIDGLETARLIRGRNRSRHTPIIFLTAYDSDRLKVEEAYSLGAVDYLVKPLIPVILRAKVMVFVELFQKTEMLRQMERRRAADIVRESEQRFALFMQNLPGLAWMKDTAGRYVYATEATATAFKTTETQLYGKTDDDLFPPATASQFKENDRRVLTEGVGVQTVESLEHADGIVHHSAVSKFPIWGADGKIVRVGGIAIDITDRLKAEETVKESEERFRQVVENIEEVFWVSDLEKDQLLYVSPAYERIWGRSCQSLYDDPRSFLEAVHPEDQERVRIESLEKQRRGEPTDLEYRIVRLDGAVRWVRSRSCPVRTVNGHTDRVTGVSEDITDRRTALDALKDASRKKDDFLAMLAHELRNPLAPIRAGVEILRQRPQDVSTVREVRDLVDRQTLHLARLVDDLLDVSRLTRGMIRLQQSRVDLGQITHHTIEDRRSACEAAGLALTLNRPAGPVWVIGDPIRLTQIIGNLLENARKFSDPGGRVSVTLEMDADDELAVLSIADTGIGIESSVLPNIFDVFVQADRTLDRSRGGLGLGLPLVKGLVELHHGFVSARSDGPGTGAEFIVKFPLEKEPKALSNEQASILCQANKKRLRILVIEDNRDAADSLRMLLELFGYDVTVAYTGSDGVEAAARARPEVVVCDIGLPGMDGFAVAAAIRKNPDTAGVRLIAVTGYGQEADRLRAFAAGFDAHLTKPADAEKLLTAIDSVAKDA